ncbi:MAG: hypothetical protein K0Q65_1531 [Clostridia bacterium]|nr:hypothetical protein [Clostridia bacterium]
MIQISILVDCIGEMCPVPLIKAQIQYKKINSGEHITIIADHSCTSQALIDAFKKFDCDVKVEEENGIWEITITKIS